MEPQALLDPPLKNNPHAEPDEDNNPIRILTADLRFIHFKYHS